MCASIREAGALISIRHLGFSYRGARRPALQDVSLEIADGAVVAVLGANGSGKSTLARLIGGLLKPSEGAVIVDGVDTARLPDGWAMHQHVGMVFQNPQNQIVSTVVENEVAFGLENLRLGSPQMQARVEECLALVGMAHLRLANPHELSAGEQQRLAIASALAANPRHLLLDEATSLLDDQSRMDLMATVSRLAHGLGLGVILITHRMDEVPIADRVIVLSHGTVVFDDSPAALFEAAERLTGWNLSLPPLQDMALALRRAGLPVPVAVATASDLAGVLWP
jgi:energy-coupling factor transport system ATP-binding protein